MPNVVALQLNVMRRVDVIRELDFHVWQAQLDGYECNCDEVCWPAQMEGWL